MDIMCLMNNPGSQHISEIIYAEIKLGTILA